MKKTIVLITVSLAMTLWAADSTPKDEVTSAAKKLGEKANYSWKATVVVPPDAQFRPGPSEGKTEKDGFTHIKVSFRETTTEVVMKGTSVAVTTPEGDWQSLAEAEGTEGRGMFVGRMVRNFKTPSAQAIDLVAAAKELKKEGDAYAAELTDEGAKTQFRFGTVTEAKGSVKFWVKDGLLSKYEIKSRGKVDFNGNTMDVDRTTTVEIKDVGNTKVEVPEGAKKKLS